jgi:multiple sugar transport system ATP-binding protein
MASVTLQNVTKVFDRRTVAVSGLSLDIPDGRFMVLVGPSGCGKTTTLRLIAGLEKASEGEISIGGKLVDSIPARDRNVAMVFQDGGLYPHMDVGRNMAFALRMRRCPEREIRRRVLAAAEVLGISDLLSRKPAALSGGQRRRVALGRAIVREPAVFLFDEPLSHLDAQLHLALRRELKDLLQRSRTTALYVTHDQAEAMAVGQRIGVLREGRLQQVGTPEEIYDHPANRFVAGFFGSPPMNFLNAQVRHESESVFLAVGDERLEVPPALSSHLAQEVGRPAIVGIRPHDLSLEPVSSAAHAVLPGAVTTIETLGPHKIVRVALGSGSACAVTVPPRTRLHAGENVRLYVHLDRLHVFGRDEAGGNLAV